MRSGWLSFGDLVVFGRIDPANKAGSMVEPVRSKPDSMGCRSSRRIEFDRDRKAKVDDVIAQMTQTNFRMN